MEAELRRKSRGKAVAVVSVCLALPVLWLGAGIARDFWTESRWIAQLSSEYPMERGEAMDELVAIGSVRAIPELLRLKAHPAPEVSDRCEPALKQILERRGAAAMPALAGALRHGDPAVREQAARLLSEFGPEAAFAIPALTSVLNDPEPRVRVTAASALFEVGAPDEVYESTVGPCLLDPDPLVRWSAADTVGSLGKRAERWIGDLVEAFDRLYKAFQEFLQALFIAHRIYPLAYNKWIREQVEGWLGLPELYRELPPMLSVRNIESAELGEKAKALATQLDRWVQP